MGIELWPSPVAAAFLCRAAETESLAAAEMTKPRVGWIGTGLMGLPMCRRLCQAGYPVTVFSRTRSKAQALCEEEDGASFAPSPMAVAQLSDIVFTMLTGAPALQQVMLGPDGALQGLRPGAIAVDTTSSEPSLARELFALGLARGVQFVDAPVSGGDVGARSGTLAFMAGGSAETVMALAPLFSCMGRVTHVGPAGSGQICKLANQIMVGANLTGLSEGLIYAEKAGLDPNQFLDAVSGGAAGSKAMEILGPKLLSQDFAPGGFAEYMVKDLGTAVRESQRMQGSFPGLALVQQLYISLIAHGDQKLGCQAVFRSLQRMNNLESSSKTK